MYQIVWMFGIYGCGYFETAYQTLILRVSRLGFQELELLKYDDRMFGDSQLAMLPTHYLLPFPLQVMCRRPE